MITLNINGVITLIKMQRLENGLKKKEKITYQFAIHEKHILDLKAQVD